MMKILRKRRCPICRSKFKEFTSITEDLTKQFNLHSFPYSIDDFETLNHGAYLCPSCGCSDRDRLIYTAIEGLVTKPDQNNKKNISILEFAPSPGLGEAIKALTSRISYSTADLYMPNVDKKVDICNMKKSYKDDSFDLIICSHVLEHVDDDISAMSELRRILKRDGFLLLLVPIIDGDIFDEDIKEKDEAKRWKRFAQNDHVRLYSKLELVKRLHRARLVVKQLGTKDIGIKSPQSIGINDKSILYLISKESTT